MAQVMVREAFYRGETVEGLFELVQDYTPFKGEGRRNGKKGAGFIKVAVEGEQLTRLAPNSKPVKLTVESEMVGYVVLAPAVPVAEFGVDTERELAEFEGLPAGIDGEPALGVFESVTVKAEVDALAALRAEFEAAKGRERDNLRKRLRRLEAKQA